MVATLGLAAISLSGATLPANAAGNTWYVSPEGSDGSGCGSTSDTCATITAALAQVEEGDVVSIAAGDYSEALEITTPVSLEGEGPGTVTINNPDTDDEPTILVDANGEVSISGVTITGSASMALGTPIVHVTPGRIATLTTVAIVGDGTNPLTGVRADEYSTVAIESSTITSVGYGVTGGGGDQVALPATVSITATTITAGFTGISMIAGTATITGGSVSGEMLAGLTGGTSGVTFDVTGTSIVNSGISGGGSFRGGVVLQGGGTFTGDGVTISGNANGITLQGGGDVTLIGSTVSGNTADEGWGIWGRPGQVVGGQAPFTLSMTGTVVDSNLIGLQLESPESVEIEGSTISNNGAGVVAGTQALDGTVTIADSAIVNNIGTATPGNQSAGSGLMLYGRLETDITNTVIDGNSAGIRTSLGTVTISGGSISENGWVGLDAIGGFSADDRGTVDLTGTVINANGLGASTAAGISIGGIVMSSFASVTGSDLTLAGNTIGAVVSSGTLSLSDSIIRDSQISSSFDDAVGVEFTGRGVIASGQDSQQGPGQVELVRTEVSGSARDGLLMSGSAGGMLLTSTVANNGGAGIRRAFVTSQPDAGPLQPLLVAGSTIADNAGGALTVAKGTTVDVIASIVQAADGVPACTGPQAYLIDLGFNIISDTSCGFDAEPTMVGDPQLSPLADNGGPSLTMLPAVSSPALDVIPVDTATSWAGSTIELCPGTFDQRGDGFLRLAREACDAGAAELAGAELTVTASDETYEGEPGPTVTPSYSGFVDGDSEAGLATLPTCGFDVDAATTSCSGAEDDFYTFTYVDGTLTVLDEVEILTESLPAGTVGEDYSVTLEATGGHGAPYDWAITNGALPTGLSLDSSTGEISGAPEEAGDFELTVSADDEATKAFTLTVNGPVLTVTASDATTYEGAFEPEVTPSYSGFLPGDSEADLATPPTCNYDVDTATTSCSGADDDLYSFEYVNGALTVLDPLAIVTESLPGATVGDEYSVTLEATGGNGGPYTWGIHEGALPAGLQIDTATGEISGIPEAAGAVTFTVFVGDPILQEFTIDVAAAPTEPTTPPTTDPTTDPTDSTTDPTDPGTSATSTPPGDADADLPDTGTDMLPLGALGAAILLLGAALLLVVRRNRAGQ